jgi:hypothetical protein
MNTLFNDNNQETNKNDLVIMFSGGTDTTLLSIRILEENKYRRVHLLTFCNGLCIMVENSGKHVQELKKLFGEHRIHHEIIYVTEIFKRIRSPLGKMIRDYSSTLAFDLCCRLSFETAAIIYALENEILSVCDGTNIDQGKLFLERPEYLRVAKDFFTSFGIEYLNPVYSKAGGRLGRRQQLLSHGMSTGPKIFEILNISTCLLHQPFCLYGFHTFFFTSFVRNFPIIKSLVKKHNLSLEHAIELRLNRQEIARKIIEERIAFITDSQDTGLFIHENFCTTKLCGQNSIEIAFPRGTAININELMENWKQKNLKFSLQGSFLNLKAGNALMQVFPNGRIIVTDTKNREKAVALFNEFIEPKFITKSIKRGN